MRAATIVKMTIAIEIARVDIILGVQALTSSSSSSFITPLTSEASLVPTIKVIINVNDNVKPLHYIA